MTVVIASLSMVVSWQSPAGAGPWWRPPQTHAAFAARTSRCLRQGRPGAARAALPRLAEPGAAAPVRRIGQWPWPVGAELAAEAVDRARGREHARDEHLQLRPGARGLHDLRLRLLGGRVHRVVEEARGRAARQRTLEQVEARLRVAVGVRLGDMALLDLDVDDVAGGVLEVEAAGERPLELGHQLE